MVMVCHGINFPLSCRAFFAAIPIPPQQVSAQGSNKIVIPFDRQQLADYLNLDRSALSKELGK